MTQPAPQIQDFDPEKKKTKATFRYPEYLGKSFTK